MGYYTSFKHSLIWKVKKSLSYFKYIYYHTCKFGFFGLCTFALLFIGFFAHLFFYWLLSSLYILNISTLHHICCDYIFKVICLPFSLVYGIFDIQKFKNLDGWIYYFSLSVTLQLYKSFSILWVCKNVHILFLLVSLRFRYYLWNWIFQPI